MTRISIFFDCKYRVCIDLMLGTSFDLDNVSCNGPITLCHPDRCHNTILSTKSDYVILHQQYNSPED